MLISTHPSDDLYGLDFSFQSGYISCTISFTGRLSGSCVKGKYVNFNVALWSREVK